MIDNHFQHKSSASDIRQIQWESAGEFRFVIIVSGVAGCHDSVTTQHCHAGDATVTTRHVVSRISTTNNTIFEQPPPPRNDVF